MTKMKKWRVVLELDLFDNGNDSNTPSNWLVGSIDNLEDGEHVRIVSEEVIEEFDGGYKIGDENEFEVGDEVLLIEVWPDEEDGEEPPVEYYGALDNFLDNDEMVGKVIDLDHSDSTVLVEWTFADEDGDEQTDSWWIIPRALKKAHVQELKVGDKVKVLRAWTPRDENPTWTKAMDETIGKVGTVMHVFPRDPRPPEVVHVEFEDGADWNYQSKVLKKVGEADPFALKAGDKVTVTATVKQLLEEGVQLQAAIELRKSTKTLERVISAKHVVVDEWLLPTPYVKKAEVVTA
jgi:hypothetical protein